MFLFHRRILSLPAPTGSLSFLSSRKGTPTYFLFPHLLIVTPLAPAYPNASPVHRGLNPGCLQSSGGAPVVDLLGHTPGHRAHRARGGTAESTKWVGYAALGNRVPHGLLGCQRFFAYIPTVRLREWREL